MNYITTSIEIEEINYIVLIGKNALGNEQIKKLSSQNDTWFHLNNISSAHLIVQNQGNPIPKKYLKQIAGMIPRNARKNCSSFIYTTVKNVKLTNVLGTVITKNTTSIKF